MLDHEPENQQSAIPAAQVRVSAEELTAAINALEEQSAQRLQGTVPIGQVVQELNLSATSEELWAQVQKQRRADAARAAVQAAQATIPDPQETFQTAGYDVRQTVTPRSWLPRRRRGRWWALFGIGWAIFGILHGSLIHGPSPRSTFSPISSSSIIISGDSEKQTYSANGKDVVISGDDCTITLHGKPRSVVVSGDDDTVITDTAERVNTTGDSDTVKSLHDPAPNTTDSGSHNSISPKNR